MKITSGFCPWCHEYSWDLGLAESTMKILKFVAALVWRFSRSIWIVNYVMYSKPELDIVFVAFTRLPSESSKRQHKTFFIHSILNNFNEQLWKFTNSIAGAVFSLFFYIGCIPTPRAIQIHVDKNNIYPSAPPMFGWFSLCESLSLSLFVCMRVNIYIYFEKTEPNK